MKNKNKRKYTNEEAKINIPMKKWILEKNIAEMVQSVRILSVDNDKLIQVNHKD